MLQGTHKSHKTLWLSNLLQTKSFIYHDISSEQISFHLILIKILEKYLLRNLFFRLGTSNFTKIEPFSKYFCIIPIIQEYLQNVDFSYLLTTILEF